MVEFRHINEVDPSQVGKRVSVHGPLGRVRKSTARVFADIINRSGDHKLQTVTEDGPYLEIARTLGQGYIVLVDGELAPRVLPEGANEDQQKELSNRHNADPNPLKDVELLTRSLDIDVVPNKKRVGIQWSEVRDSKHLSNELNYPEIAMLPEFLRVMKIRQGIGEVFLEHFDRKGFVRIPVPALTTSVSENGAEVFRFQGQSGELSLIQSPQQLKQFWAERYGQVVWVGPAFRNDPSNTSWHLAEFTALDVELQPHFINDKVLAMKEVMGHLSDVINAISAEVSKHSLALQENKSTVPLLNPKGIPSITYKDAIELAGKAGIKNWGGRWDRLAEKAVARYFLNTFDSDYYFITHFPIKEKVFYTEPVEPRNPDSETYSFDLICRGVEISSGGLRINDPQLIREQMRLKGVNEKDCRLYLQHFDLGASQTGGFGMGLERFMALVLGTSAQVVTPFPKRAGWAVG